MDHGLHRFLSFNWLHGGLLFFWKNPPKGCTILVLDFGIFYSRAVVQRTIVDIPPCVWSTVRRKRLRFMPIQTVIRTSRRLGSFSKKVAQNFVTLFQKFITKIKKQKPKAVLKAYPMIPFSYRSILAGRYLLIIPIPNRYIQCVNTYPLAERIDDLLVQLFCARILYFASIATFWQRSFCQQEITG